MVAPKPAKENRTTHSTGHLAFSQELPADQRAPERKECLVDVGSLVTADAQAAKLAQPRKCALDDSPPPAQATAVLGAAHRQPGHDVPRPETAPNRRRIVAAITKHTARTPPRSPAFALERGNRINQWQGFLRVIPVRAGEADGEGHAPPVADQMALAPGASLGRGIGTGLVSCIDRAHRATITTARDQSIWP
jgi:hypothetical protein